MSDLMTRLAALHDDAPGAPGVPDDGVVAADLRRGHAALSSRRRRRAGVAGATLGVVAVGSLSYAATTGGSGGAAQRPQAATSTSTGTRPATGVELVAYKGTQLPGYTVEQIPSGYVLQGISGSVLDVAAKGDHSSLDVFSGKLVVMLNDHPGPTDGAPVTVDGHAGRITDQDGVQALTYNDGTHDVEVQAWSNITITRDQLVRFAEGVTVLPGAEVGHG